MQIKTDYELKYCYSKNRQKAWKHFSFLIDLMKLTRPDVKIVLHHQILGCTNYEDWNVDELIPMYFDEHRKLHGYGKGKYGIPTDNPMYKSIAAKSWRKANPEKVHAYQEAYNEKHHDVILQRSCDYHKKNRDVILQKRRKIYVENSEHYRNAVRDYRSNMSPEAKEAHLQRRREIYAQKVAAETPEEKMKRMSDDRQRARRYCENNRQKVNAMSAKRYAKMKANETLEEKANRRERDNKARKALRIRKKSSIEMIVNL